VALAYSKVIYKLDAEQKLKFTDRAYKKWHLGNIGFTVLLMIAAIFVLWTSPYISVVKPTAPAMQPTTNSVAPTEQAG
jgi:hypothetical protein